MGHVLNMPKMYPLTWRCICVKHRYGGFQCLLVRYRTWDISNVF